MEAIVEKWATTCVLARTSWMIDRSVAHVTTIQASSKPTSRILWAHAVRAGVLVPPCLRGEDAPLRHVGKVSHQSVVPIGVSPGKTMSDGTRGSVASSHGVHCVRTVVEGRRFGTRSPALSLCLTTLDAQPRSRADVQRFRARRRGAHAVHKAKASKRPVLRLRLERASEWT